MEKEIIKSKFEEIKKYIGETDAESRSKFDGFIEWLKENNSPEVQKCLCVFIEDGRSLLEAEVADLRREIGGLAKKYGSVHIA